MSYGDESYYEALSGFFDAYNKKPLHSERNLELQASPLFFAFP